MDTSKTTEGRVSPPHCVLIFRLRMFGPVVRFVIEQGILPWTVTRMDYSFQGCHPPSQLAAMAASYNPALEQAWYADSGATNHITHDPNNLSLHSNFKGKD